ncbi:hypothetical protein JYU34_011722 [Plutella xylostella]|uniref:TLC domain-containing protein n=1 Tax=Plutella xylostella TaxID=51655 RepID=A0ABQ7QEQ6_PLUXY|nr:hypothetical protein JYU34_011722 [Plutella xylostella]
MDKLVSAVQALLCVVTGAVVCLYSCSRDVVRTSHYMSEAYAWFGAAYFFYDIWSMYTVYVQQCFDKSSANQNGPPPSAPRGGGDLSPPPRAPSFFTYCRHDPVILLHHVFIGGFGFAVIVASPEARGRPKRGPGAAAPSALSSPRGDDRAPPPPPSFLAYCRHDPVILLHHVFIGWFGFAVIVHLRGDLGDCVFGFAYLMELSTPFVSLRGVLSRVRQKSSPLYVLNGLVMLATFCVCRVLALPAAQWLYARHTQMNYFDSSPLYVVNGLVMLATFCVLALPAAQWLYARHTQMNYFDVSNWTNNKSSPLYVVNGLVMLATFCVCRVLALPAAQWLYARHTQMNYFDYDFEYSAAVSIQDIASLPRGCKISICILLLPQLYWFYLMSRGAVKVLFETTPAVNDSKVDKEENKPKRS